MACAHCIDVELLHYLDVLYHAVNAYHISGLGVEFVAVGTLYQYRLSVHEHLRALDLHLSESYLLAHGLNLASVFLECDVESI